MEALLTLFSISVLLTTACLETQENTRNRTLPDTSTPAEVMLNPQSQESKDAEPTMTPSVGASLECETCFASRNSCLSGKEMCESGEDICVITLTETSKGGKTMSTIEKGCYVSENCSSASVLVTFGQGEFHRKSTLCCLGEDCKEDSPPWPLINMTANGKYCPACYSELEPCPTKIAKCTGSENHCLDLTVHKYPEKSITLKGCITEPSCNALRSGKLDFFDTDKADINVNCRPASQVSQPTGCLLLALSGLLLMMVLL
ncbi:phospholipase A2 inhibitor and Ly6/PLAUR domain-containing protein-like [Python bivittatus]|uniref:Phospholipase A2 inhibitor and Ly6/PLAUR domain-containing protein-like n=1 Tax=Python bivittatus TaxID=176946 RepID=A0A9F2R540_PYTBI|nr:phospholipase A2 inhibitor and Ly6/PLAUR domain-containing protein-like [Python bivittatus]XP_007436183.1 phospholipase A2 inhibitor and Ly6/PLAUR domain-containing protein-like [Python bivittatus]